MIHLPDFISDLGIILITAAAVTLLFRYLNQPVVLGYIIAGFLVSPHITLIPTIKEVSSVRIWAGIGVIFLLFDLGLHFSFKKLVQVGKGASITALIEVTFMFCLGFLLGQIFGWSRMDSLFLGGIVSISSTTIIVRAFDNLGYKNRKFVKFVFGLLVVEDLFAVLLLVLLSTVAVTQTLSGVELLHSGFRLAFFLVLWFLVGIYFLPLLLKKIRPLLTDETTLIVSIGLCLTMVILATKAGYSPALGAFIIGSILAETEEGKQIRELFIPVRDLFAAIFFVSVGMLIDPHIILIHGWTILVITIVLIIGKFLGVFLGSMISGQSLKISTHTGMSLAQIGEFSFIIATLGLTLNVTSNFLYPITVAVSAITTFSTPYMIRNATRFYEWLNKKISPQFTEKLEKYQFTIQTRSEPGMFHLLWKAFGLKISLNAVVVIAITLGMKQFLLPYFITQIQFSYFLTCLLALLLSTPFLWAITFSKPILGESELKKYGDKINDLQIGLAIIRFGVVVTLLIFVVSQFSSLGAISGLVLLLFAFLIIFFSRHAQPFYTVFEKKFLSNLNDQTEEVVMPRPQLAPWDGLLAELVVSPNSPLVTKNLKESNIKEKFGVTVTLIERGNRQIMAPRGDDVLLPMDRLFVIGTDEQIESARNEIETKSKAHHVETDSFGLDTILLSEDSPFIGQTVRNSNLRELINGIIVGIERNGDRILNPDPNLELRRDDVLWVVGNLNLIKKCQFHFLRRNI